MTTQTALKLEQVLNNNPQQPVIVIGASDLKISNFIDLPADIDERELHIPSHWHKRLNIKAENNKAVLFIGNLDSVPLQKQEQFARLLKDRRAGNYKLPANVQIVISASDKNRLSEKICSLALVWDAR